MKVSFLGAPAAFALNLHCKAVNDAFPEAYGCYLVGSALRKPDWRDVDVRMILPDEEFDLLFPNAIGNGSWELDSRWQLLTIGISMHLSKSTGLPVDFQFQPASFANITFDSPRQPLGIIMSKERKK